MESLQVPNAQKTYCWDDIEVGNLSKDNSQNFFAIRHIKHEKLDDIELIQNKMAGADLQESFEKCTDINEILAEAAIRKEPENIQDIVVNAPVEPKTEETEQVVAIEDNKENTKTNENPVAPLILCWSTQKPIVSKKIVKTGGDGKGAIGKNCGSAQRTPEAYHFKDVYQGKKLEAERKRAEEERKMREFHCRPAPNFRAMHERLKNRVIVHKISVPLTPKTLKTSLQFKQKKEAMRKKLMEEEAAAAAASKAKHESREPRVLFKEPFVPKKANNVLQPRPFHLQSAKRAEERKQFDAHVQQAFEEKRKKEEEERKRLEEEKKRELKKMTTFKARPNPFK